MRSFYLLLELGIRTQEHIRVRDLSNNTLVCLGHSNAIKAMMLCQKSFQGFHDTLKERETCENILMKVGSYPKDIISFS